MAVGLWSLLILLLGLGDLVAIAKGWRRWRYLFKPGTMVAIILLAATGQGDGGIYSRLVVAGLILSVMGDIFLVLPSDRFVLGLGSFLMAHLVYIYAFAGPLDVGVKGLGFAVALGLVAGLIYRRLHAGVVEQGGKGLVAPVLLYMLVIATMVWRALLTGDPLIAAGALLFFASDGILAWNRFVHPHRLADLGVMTTYFAAQYLIALSSLGL